MDSRLSRRQILELALCYHSRAPDSQRERPRVGDGVGTISLSLPQRILQFSALIFFAELVPMMFALIGYTLELQQTPVRSCHHKVVSVCQTRSFLFLVVEQVS